MYINGKWISQADKTFAVFNPATGQKIGEAVDGGSKEAAEAIQAAHTAFLSWSKATAYQRSRYLYDAYRIMVEEKAEIPAGVANLVTALDPAPVGQEFLSNPLVRKLTFTGSTGVGKLLAKGAAEQMKRISLELGGHAPFIVCLYTRYFPGHAHVRSAAFRHRRH